MKNILKNDGCIISNDYSQIKYKLEAIIAKASRIEKRIKFIRKLPKIFRFFTSKHEIKLWNGLENLKLEIIKLRHSCERGTS